MPKPGCRSLFGCCALLALALVPASGADTPAKTDTKATTLIATYRGTTNVAERLKALRGLEAVPGSVADRFLEEEFSQLDATREPGRQLAGGILQIWATRPNRDVLPYLIYEGLFHEDAEVVRACAGGINRRPDVARALMSTGRAAPGAILGQGLATDLLQQLEARPEVVPALERVLVIWTGHRRDGYRPEGRLDRPYKDAERAAALAFWKAWYEGRFPKQARPTPKP